ncbi:dihydrofolate reductase [Sporosarcina pasteurii]|uniref:Dihydrofolate reductase n=1 Tax=Sporosarcina pasteurii TaxID=1474 RepID=A0A380BSY5_SPOPA|nr:dihydrofolate reductase [Sporosarcina pasteurii]MDS9471240.1 dihydrofolate reductase [Sporosarcina pasteurii]QBQ05125.1 dihydrofolate reductase [Sporosarcina pasteurii]SUJ06050.1 Dihydrofolate reductase [Sporosarcina pasteurii]
MISLMVAHDPDRVIGLNNDLPWHIPEDLKYFKEKTMGKAMVMGRKTYESIGRPLPGRLSIVVTRNKSYSAEGVVVAHDLDEAIQKAKEYADEVMIIGGAEIFKLMMDIADRLYITEVHEHFKGDTFFPEYTDGWRLTDKSEVMTSINGTTFSYLIYDKEK